MIKKLVSLTPSQVAKINEVCEKDGYNFSDIVRRCLDKSLDFVISEIK